MICFIYTLSWCHEVCRVWCLLETRVRHNCHLDLLLNNFKINIWQTFDYINDKDRLPLLSKFGPSLDRLMLLTIMGIVRFIVYCCRPRKSTLYCLIFVNQNALSSLKALRSSLITTREGGVSGCYDTRSLKFNSLLDSRSDFGVTFAKVLNAKSWWLVLVWEI